MVFDVCFMDCVIVCEVHGDDGCEWVLFVYSIVLFVVFCVEVELVVFGVEYLLYVVGGVLLFE